MNLDTEIIENRACYLCGKKGGLDSHCKELGKFYPVHEICLLRKRCFHLQDRIEALEKENLELMRKNRLMIRKAYK